MLVIAHRGASGTLPENTPAAFEKAIRLDAEMIELDVHLCKTGEPVVIHDPRVNRTTNGRGFVSHKTLSQLQSLDAGNGEKIPTLKEVFDLVGGKVKINIELKGNGVVPETVRLIKQQIENKNQTAGQFIISSFNRNQLKEFHTLMPELPIGILYERPPAGFQKLAEELHASSINLSRKHVSENLIREIHRHGLQVWVYTVNSMNEFEGLKAMGVDAVFSNFPEYFIP